MTARGKIILFLAGATVFIMITTLAVFVLLLLPYTLFLVNHIRPEHASAALAILFALSFGAAVAVYLAVFRKRRK
jgi:hypothetical protein